jgi:hypothetical protein
MVLRKRDWMPYHLEGMGQREERERVAWEGCHGREREAFVVSKCKGVIHLPTQLYISYRHAGERRRARWCIF